MSNLVTVDTVDKRIDDTIRTLKTISPELEKLSLNDIIALISKENITVTSDGKVTLPKEFISLEVSDKETETKNKSIDKESEKVKNAFRIAYDKSETYDPIKKQDFLKNFSNLILYLKSRETAIAAFEDLMTSREKRNFAVQIKEENAKKAKEENSKKNSDNTIASSMSTMDLDKLNFDALTPEQKLEWQKRYKKLEEEELEYYKAFKDLSDENLADIINNFDDLVENDPKKASAILKVVKEKKEKVDKSKTKEQTPKTNLSEEDKNSIKSSVQENRKGEEKTEQSKSEEPYTDSINVAEDKTTININRTLYYFPTSLKDSITFDENGEPSIITLKKLSNGQKVQWLKSSNEKTFNELFEVLGLISASSKTSREISADQSIKLAQEFLKDFKKKSFDTDITLNSEASLEMFKGAVKQLLSTISKLTQIADQLKYSHDSASLPFSGVTEYQTIVSYINEYAKIKDTYTDIIANKLKAEEILTAEAVDNDVKTNDERLTPEEITEISKTIQEIKEQINSKSSEKDDAIDNGDVAKVEQLNKELEDLAIKLKENENRIPSQASEGMENPQGPPKSAQEQGAESKSQRDNEIPKSQKPGENLVRNIRNLKTEPNTGDDSIDEDGESEDFNEIEEDEETEENNNISSTDIKLYVFPLEYDINDNQNIIVDKNGNPKTSSNLNKISQTIKIKPQLLASELIQNQIEDALSFEIIEDSEWWNQRKNEIAPNDYWREIPIYIRAKFQDGEKEVSEIISLLTPFENGRNSIREDIYKALIKNKNVTATLQSKVISSRNIANANTADNKSYFYNIPVNSKLAIAIIKEGGSNAWVTSEGEILDRPIRDEDLGRVAILVPDINTGEDTPLILHTNNITEEAYEAFKERVIEEEYSQANEIIGFNSVYDYKELILNASPELRYNVYYDLFASSQEALTFFHEGIGDEGMWVTVGFDELSKLYSGQQFKYKIIKQDQEGEEEQIDEESFKDLYESGYATFENSLKESLLSKKFQVDKTLLRSNEPYVSKITGLQYDSYLEYLTSSTEGSKIGIGDDVTVNGHTSILKTDIHFNPKNNSPYFNVTPKITKLKVNDTVISEDTSADFKIETNAGTFNEPAVIEKEDEENTQGGYVRRVAPNASKITPTDTEGNEPTDLKKLIEEQNKKKVKEGKEADTTKITDTTGNKITDMFEAVEKEFEASGSKMLKDEEGVENKYQIGDEIFRRATTLIYPPFTGTEEQKKNFMARGFVGTEVGKLFQAMITGQTFTRPEFMSVNAFLGIKYNAYTFLKKLDKKKEEVIEKVEVLVKSYNKFGKPDYAGRIDILTKNKFGVRKIYDIKTGSQKSLDDYEKDEYDADEKVSKKSKRKLHGGQMSLYGYAINNMAFNEGMGDKNIVDNTGVILFMVTDIVLSEDGDPKKTKITNVNPTVDKMLKLSFERQEITNKNSKITYKSAEKKTKTAENVGTNRTNVKLESKNKESSSKDQKKNLKANKSKEYNSENAQKSAIKKFKEYDFPKSFKTRGGLEVFKDMVENGFPSIGGGQLMGFDTKEELEILIKKMGKVNDTVEWFKEISEALGDQTEIVLTKKDADKVYEGFMDILNDTYKEQTC